MSIFGTVVSLPYKAGTIVFIAVLFALMILEGVLHAAETFCHRNGLHGLIRKLYKEFMILGLISFTIFIISEVYHFDARDEWYLSFEFAHIVFLFMGINFVLESFLLVALIDGRNKQLLRHDNSSSETLLLEYLDLQRRGGFMKRLFDYGLVSIPLPELREKIEYKIIQEYFVRSYNLPAEFKFANYLCTLLKSFVFSLLEVRPISWFLIAVLAVLNFVRIRVIDHVYQSEVCHRYHTHFHFQPSKKYGEHVCEEYTLRYFFSCSMFLTVYLICVFFASEMYMQRLIGKVLDEEELLEQIEKEEELAVMKKDGGGFDHRSVNYNNSSQSFGGIVGKKNAKSSRAAQLNRYDSNNSDFGGEIDTTDEFILEASHNMNHNISTHAAPPAEPSSPSESGSPTTNRKSAFGNGLSKNRKVSYGDVNTVSFHVPSTSSAVQNLTVTSESLSGESSPVSSNNNSNNNLGAAVISESLKYDLQSEDEESMFEKRNAAAAAEVALKAVQDRKNYASVHASEGGEGGAEKQLRRSISEFNVHKAATGGRRHLYSLCLQRIMLVEFELLAHQGRKATGHPPVAKKLEGRKQSIMRRLGSFFAPASRDDAEDSHDGISADLELATANSFRNASSQVLSLSRKMSLYSQNGAAGKTLTPQEYLSGSSITRRRSAHSLKSHTNNDSSIGFSGMGFGSQASMSAHSTGGAKGDVLPPAPRASSQKHAPSSSPSGISTKSNRSALSAANRTYSAHYFEMETPAADNRRAVPTDSMFDLSATGNGLCAKIVRFFLLVFAFGVKCLTQLWHMMIGHEDELEEPDEDVAIMQEELRSIFLWDNPDLYFFTVEFALLAQCLYIALWATSFIVIAKNSYFPGLWEAALLVPVPFNFWLIQKTIFSACTLKAVVSLDRTVADKICEEALDARNVTERLRKIIRSTLVGLNFEKIKWNGFLHEQFYLFKKDGAVGLNEKEMRLFLHSLQIFLTDTSVSRIFSVIDFDRDGRVTWKELSDIVFPELTQQQLKVNRKASHASKATKSVKASKSAKRKSIVGGKSEKSTSTPTSSTKKPTFGNFGGSSEKTDDASLTYSTSTGYQSFKPSSALHTGKSELMEGASFKSVSSAKSGDFNHDEADAKLASEYTAIKDRPNSPNNTSTIRFAPTLTTHAAPAAVAAAEWEETDSNDSDEAARREEYLSRYDAEDADFGASYVNHRIINLRNKLTQQRAEKEENEEVFLDDNTEDFWGNGESTPSPEKKKRSIFFGV